MLCCSAALPYFISCGFELPPNENPADFFLDIVSGCVPCQANPEFSTEVGPPTLAHSPFLPALTFGKVHRVFLLKASVSSLHRGMLCVP